MSALLKSVASDGFGGGIGMKCKKMFDPKTTKMSPSNTRTMVVAIFMRECCTGLATFQSPKPASCPQWHQALALGKVSEYTSVNTNELNPQMNTRFLLQRPRAYPEA